MRAALVLAAMAPLVLMGCVAHDAYEDAVAPAPVPAYVVAMPVPPAPPPPPVAPGALTRTIATLGANFDATMGIAVRSIDAGWSVAYNGEQRLPQQSVSKLWVALTAMDLLDQGRLRLDDPVTIRREDLTLFHQPVAALVKGDGYRTTVGELLRRAMTQSDNTANDRLLSYVGGPPAVRSFLSRRGIANVRFGPGERLLQSGTAGLTWTQPLSLGRAFYDARARLPQTARVAAYNAYVADPPDGASASGIVDALARLKEGRLLSAASTRWLLDTMGASRTGHARLRAGTPAGWALAHKTGTGQDLLGRTAGFNDVGILTAPDGRSYAVAVLIGDTARPPRDRQQLMQQVASAIAAAHVPTYGAQRMAK